MKQLLTEEERDRLHPLMDDLAVVLKFPPQGIIDWNAAIDEEIASRAAHPAGKGKR